MSNHTTMIDGMRGHQHFPDRPTDDSYIPEPDRPVDPDQFVIFHCKARNYRLQFTSKADMLVDGVVIKGEGLSIQAKDYMVRLDKRDDKDARIIERALRSPFFGVGKEFWLPEEMAKAVMRKKVEDVRETLKDPAFIEALKSLSGTDDFATANVILNAITQVGEAPDFEPEGDKKKKK